MKIIELNRMKHQVFFKLIRKINERKIEGK